MSEVKQVVLARCDCPKRHWLARVEKRHGIEGITYRLAANNWNRETDTLKASGGGMNWESLEELSEGGSSGGVGPCPGGCFYRIDTVDLARRFVGGEPVVVLSRIPAPPPIDVSRFRR